MYNFKYYWDIIYNKFVLQYYLCINHITNYNLIIFKFIWNIIQIDKIIISIRYNNHIRIY